jgi:hypothetical protein
MNKLTTNLDAYADKIRADLEKRMLLVKRFCRSAVS